MTRKKGTREREFLIKELLDFSIILTVYSGEQSNYASNNEKLQIICTVKKDRTPSKST